MYVVFIFSPRSKQAMLKLKKKNSEYVSILRENLTREKIKNSLYMTKMKTEKLENDGDEDNYC